MEQIISKEELEELMKIKGEVRGVAIKTTIEFILKEQGEEGLKKLEDAMVKVGYPIKYREIKTMDFYPLRSLAVMLVAIKRLFNYDEENFHETGRFQVKTSILIRIFMKYFVSIEKATKELPKIWKQHFTVGNLKALEFDKERKYLILIIKDFRFHPLYCQVLVGVFPTALQMILKTKVTCQETKCVYRGDEHHEFLMKW